MWGPTRSFGSTVANMGEGRCRREWGSQGCGPEMAKVGRPV